ncbi:MAG TPA: SRPBCC domain-containing protein, partial [Hyphomicrobiaceae bacterium]|nr:SRPBCC domain-containing protein [Hyphomicrobiaceae bacterium]
ETAMASASERRRPADPALVITRIFNAPRELVFKAWTDPRLAVQWWGPRDYPATHLEMDARPGGTWGGRLKSTADGRELGLKGVFREVVAPERLVFTFAWEEEGERGLETLVTITFAERNGKTVMTFRHEPFQSIEEQDGHQGGWNSTFDRLEEYLARAATAQ